MIQTDPVTHNPETLVKLAWIALAAVGIVTSSFTIMGIVAFRKSESPAITFSRMFERAQAMKMITVLLIVVSATMLAFFGIIDSNGVVGILSGVAGYVLGGLEKGKTSSVTKAEDSGKREAFVKPTDEAL